MLLFPQGIRNTVNEYLLSFGGYDWLWKDDKDEAYDDFMSKNPSLDDYEAKLKTFSATEDEIGENILRKSFEKVWVFVFTLDCIVVGNDETGENPLKKGLECSILR